MIKLDHSRSSETKTIWNFKIKVKSPNKTMQLFLLKQVSWCSLFLFLPGGGFTVVLEMAVKSASFLEEEGGRGGTEEEKLAGCRVFLAFPRTAAAVSWEPGQVVHSISSAVWRRAWRVEEVWGAKMHHGSSVCEAPNSLILLVPNPCVWSQEVCSVLPLLFNCSCLWN